MARHHPAGAAGEEPATEREHPFTRDRGAAPRRARREDREVRVQIELVDLEELKQFIVGQGKTRQEIAASLVHDRVNGEMDEALPGERISNSRLAGRGTAQDRHRHLVTASADGGDDCFALARRAGKARPSRRFVSGVSYAQESVRSRERASAQRR